MNADTIFAQMRRQGLTEQSVNGVRFTILPPGLAFGSYFVFNRVTVRPRRVYTCHFRPHALWSQEAMVYDQERGNAIIRALEDLPRAALLPRPKHSCVPSGRADSDCNPWPEDFTLYPKL